MFPRYGRKNRRYKVRLTSKKMSYGQKVKWQVILSALFLVVGIGMSFFSFPIKTTVREYLYGTYTFSQWKETISPPAKRAGKFSKKAVSLYMSMFKSDGKKTKRTVSHTPSAKADSLSKEDTLKKKTSAEATQAEEKPKENWIWPHSGEISSPFGERIHPISGQKSFHGGIDIAAPWGDDVKAVHSGIVERTGYDDSNGNYVVLSHGDEITSVYIHLSEVCVKPGESVPSEGLVGKVGSTGLATGPHIHFEIKEKGQSVNPNKYIIG